MKKHNDAHDRPGHRRFSLKQALREAPMAINDIARLPVYTYLAQSKPQHVVIATIKDDIAALRRGGEDIEVRTAELSSYSPDENRAHNSTEYRYYLRDCATINVPSKMLNMSLLLPLLEYKEQSDTEAFAQIGMRKILAGNSEREKKNTDDERGRVFKLALPSGRFAPMVARAVQQKKFLRCMYTSLEDQAAHRRTLYPLSLEIHQQAFYVRAQKFIQKKENQWINTGSRLYKIDRMKTCEIIENPHSEGLSSEILDHGGTADHTSGRGDSWFAPVDVLYWAAQGACTPLTLRSEYVRETSGDVPGAVYVLRDVDRFQFLEDLAFYAGSIRLLGPHEFIDFAREQINYACQRINTAPASPQPKTFHARQSAQVKHKPARSVDITVSRRESYFTYLLKNGPTSLGDLARHFRVDPTTVRKELSDLYTTEVKIGTAIVSPYDMRMPYWDGQSPVDPAWVIEALPGPYQPLTMPPHISMNLPEVISLLAAIDSLLAVAEGDHLRSLTDMRHVLTCAATEAGYAQALWPAPTTRFAPHILTTIEQAICDYQWLTITYWKLNDAGISEEYETHIQPFALDPQAHPLLAAYNEHSQLRTYRLDRISRVRLRGKHFKKTPVRTWIARYRNRQMHIDGTPVLIHIRAHGKWICEQIPNAEIIFSSSVPEQATDSTAAEERSTYTHLTVRIHVAHIHWLRTVIVRLGKDFLGIEPAYVASALQDSLSSIKF